MKKLAAQFCHNALSRASDLPAGERADFYDFAADVLKQHDTDMAHAAREHARDLRDAEASQMKFHALISCASN